jgi:hypothetical protein
MSVRQQPEQSGSSRSRHALRLTFEFEGEEIRLVNRQELQKRTAPSDPVEARANRNRSGFWIELQGARNRTLYRLVMDSPIERSVEVPTGNREQPYRRHTVAHREGMFFAIVPDLPEAETVAIYSSPTDPAAAAERAREIARFDLRERPKGAGDATGKKGGAS